MKRLALFPILLCVLLVPFALSPALDGTAPADARDGQEQITEVRMLISDGLVPAEYISFRSDGTAMRIASTRIEDPRLDYPETTVRYEGKIPPLQWNRLAALTESIGFFDLPPLYTSYDWEPSYLIGVRKGGRMKSVMDRNGNKHGGAGTPIQLWGLEMAIKGLASEVKWQPVEENFDAAQFLRDLDAKGTEEKPLGE